MYSNYDTVTLLILNFVSNYKNNIHIATDWIPNDVSSTKIRYGHIQC